MKSITVESLNQPEFRRVQRKKDTRTDSAPPQVRNDMYFNGDEPDDNADDHFLACPLVATGTHREIGRILNYRSRSFFDSGANYDEVLRGD